MMRRLRGLLPAGPLLFFVIPFSLSQPAVRDDDVATTMRDGVILRASVVKPPTAGPFPVLIYRTPYGKDQELKEYTTFQHAVERGYAVMVQDVRGRYASGGVFLPYQSEGHDGYDTIEWAARQPWSNGKVGTFGLSYPGAAQWLAAVEGPPHLLAMVPAMTYSSHRNFFYAGGTFDMSWIEWLWDNIAPDLRVKENLPGPRTADEAEAAWREQGLDMELALPLSKMGSLKDTAPFYYEWLRHPMEDSWWGWADLAGKYGHTNAAVLNLSGWYDEHYGPEGAVTNYRGLLAARGAGSPKTALLIGPWIHGVDSTHNARAGERTFARASNIDYDATVLDWMDHYVRGIDNGVDHAAPVRYYVMGAETWRESRVWPPRSKPTAYYLSGARPKMSGTLSSTAPIASDTSAFVSDPRHPVMDAYSGALGAHDYRELVRREDLLTFDTIPLSADTEITGPIDADLFLSCDCRDFDLWMRVYDVSTDGTAWNLMSTGNEVQRVSYRDAAAQRRLIEPGQIIGLRISGPATSNLFRRGHRIRVQLSGSFSPIFSRNLQTGDLEADSDRTRTATIRLHQDPRRRSRITLPVISP
jgi:uncharacterized protein